MRKGLLLVLVLMVVFGMPGACLALGGKVSYPDGSPAVGATVTLSSGEEERSVTVTCDAQGRFDIGAAAPADAYVRISAPDGKDYVGASLPAALFEGNGLAVVLQPRK
ncbi:MAG: hypothetical protein C0617_06405 [Desulfuromonas sp.]|mgnify:CR=1 FL=1|uniref:carboxypeptidase-like regulatory domain-containing protein n=1 Tax=Desulfuromonas sp. TaxID=892 RepID=UPI000CB2F166|nr:carboxypeptidase-like regulatory domain-containing protein [Desulfuromonas sp.]PLX84839.1 MAG: hypothetical protein C0617_06405 [Desulfuromonas sp.]